MLVCVTFCVKVADFGLAARIKPGEEIVFSAILTTANPEDRLFDAVGTPNYIAPEILLCLEIEPEGYSYEVDMWSAGVLLKWSRISSLTSKQV